MSIRIAVAFKWTFQKTHGIQKRDVSNTYICTCILYTYQPVSLQNLRAEQLTGISNFQAFASNHCLSKPYSNSTGSFSGISYYQDFLHPSSLYLTFPFPHVSRKTKCLYEDHQTLLKDLVPCSGPFRKLISGFFFITK